MTTSTTLPEGPERPVTPLQLILATRSNFRLAQTATGRSRQTVWRWRNGLSRPERIDAEKLIAAFALYSLDYDGCYSQRVVAAPPA